MNKKKSKIVYNVFIIATLLFCLIVSCVYVYREIKYKFLNINLSSNNNSSSITVTDEIKSGWFPEKSNPVIGNEETTGTVFDPFVMEKDGKYYMYVSTRKDGNIGLSESNNGKDWSKIKTVLSCDVNSGWEFEINRCSVVFYDEKYYMYYTGQQNNISRIGVAIGDNVYNFKKHDGHILSPEYKWEGESVMNPFVIYDEDEKIFKMWYSAGETYEPDVICYAESKDGINFHKYENNPIFLKGDNWYDCDKVSVGHIIKKDGKYIMFYIGYENVDTARVCYAVSKDGKNNWQRGKNNPIIGRVANTWNKYAVYKPSVIYDNESERWLLWCNGRSDLGEFIGLYYYNGSNFGY